VQLDLGVTPSKDIAEKHYIEPNAPVPNPTPTIRLQALAVRARRVADEQEHNAIAK
jgi:hypothetical protein